MGEKLASDKKDKHHTHDDMFRFLAIVNDHLYQRDWLVANAEEINRTIRSAIHQPPIYHYAVATLIDVIPVMLTQANFKTWGSHLLDSLVYAQGLGDSDLIAKLSLTLARYHSMIGEPSAAEGIANRAQEYIREGSIDVHIEAYAALIEAYLISPKKNFKPEILEEALSISEQSDDYALKALIHQMLSVAYLHKHEYAKAETHTREALELADKMRDEAAMFRAALINASVQRHLLNWNAVRTSLSKAWELWNTSSAPHKTQRNYLLLSYEEATLHHRTGEPKKAILFYKEALDSVTGATDAYEVGLCRLGLTLVYIASGEYEKASETLQAAKPIWKKLDNKYMIAHTIYTEGYIGFKNNADPFYTRERLEAALQATQDIPDEKTRESLAREIRETLADLLSGTNATV